MKKNKHIPFIIISVLLIFTACDNENIKSSNDTIQLWYYEHPSLREQIIGDILKAAKDYCNKNDLSLDIVKFDSNTLSYEDYVFKRNLASENGNMIILDTISHLSDLAKRHADYNKIEIYDNLLNAYKDRFCIPIGRRLNTSFFDNNILEYYQIDNSKKLVITYTDFLQLKQDMKKKGAKFEPKDEDLYETVKYYLNKNGLLYINKQDDILKNNNKLKEVLKKILFDICEDIIIYNNADLEKFQTPFKISSSGFELYDTNSALYLKKVENYIGLYNSPIYNEWFEDARIINCSNKTYIIDYFGVDYFNFGNIYSLFIDKKITNEKIYDLMNYILEQTNSVYSEHDHKLPLFTPVFYTDDVKNKLNLNDKLEYTGLASNEERKIMNATFDIFIKNKVKSKEIADAYFSDNSIVRSIESLIYDTINEIAEKLSENSSDSNLSLKNFDSENEEINKLVDEKIDEFIKQLILKIN